MSVRPQRHTGAMSEVALLTVDNLTVDRYLGGVSGWSRNADLALAEATALDELRRSAASLGANAVVGWRVEIAIETSIGSQSPRGTEQVLVASSSTTIVYAYGTAAVVARSA